MIGNGRNFPRQRSGGEIRARDLNAVAQTLAQQTRRRVGPGLASVDLAGIPLERSTLQARVWVRLVASGGGGVYSWQGIYQDPANPGTWADLLPGVSGTWSGDPSNASGTTPIDPAYEANQNASIAPGTRVELVRAPGTQLRTFQFGNCS